MYLIKSCLSGFSNLEKPHSAGVLIRNAILFEITAYGFLWDTNQWTPEEKETARQKSIRSRENSCDKEKPSYRTIKRERKILPDRSLINRVETNHCQVCGIEISPRATHCIKHARIKHRKTERPPKCILIALARSFAFTEIAEMYGISARAVQKWFTTENLPGRKAIINSIPEDEWYTVAWNYAEYASYYENSYPKRTKEINIDDIIKSYSTGKTMKEIAIEYDKDPSTISKILKKNGIAINTQPSARIVKCPELNLQCPSIKNMAETLIKQELTHTQSVDYVKQIIREILSGKRSNYRELTFEIVE